jgi:CrcB protein
MPLVQKIGILAVTGTLGTLARYFLSKFCNDHVTPPIPLGTIVVNLVGCFLFGLLAFIPVKWIRVDDATRALAMSGFIGAFTTFSTFAFETHELFASGHRWLAAGNLLFQNIAGILAIAAGATLGSRL